MIAGADSGAFETWEWDGTAWTRFDAPGPSARTEPAMAYDAQGGSLVLFGGDRGLEGPVADTWTWDGRRWERIDGDGPSPRTTLMVYDARRDRIVLFGGGGPNGALLNDTWEFDGARWRRLTIDGDPASPPARALHGLAYDERRGRVVLHAGFGGFDQEARRPIMLGDTWEWDGTRWHRIPVAGPGGRDHVALAWSPALGAVVLHGGGRAEVGLVGDTWKFDGARWLPVLDGGPPRGRHRLVTDPRHGSLLLYGGWAPGNVRSAELFAFSSGSWRRVSPP